MAKRPKLPVLRTVAESWRLLIAQWRFSLLLGLSLVAFMLLVLPAWQSLVALPLANMGAMRWLSAAMIEYVVWDLLMDAPLYLGLAVAIVPLHRRILIGEDRRLPFRFKRHEAAYAAYLFLLEAGVAVLIAALTLPMVNVMLDVHLRILNLAQDGVIPDVVRDAGMPVVTVAAALLVGGPIMYGLARLSLALPGLAIGTPSAVALGWRSGRGNGWRLVAVTVLVTLPAILPLLLMISVWSGDSAPVMEGPILLDEEALRNREWPAPFVPPSAAMALGAVLYALATLPGAAALSLAYKRLAGTDAEAKAGAIS